VVGEDVAGLGRAAATLATVVGSGSSHPCDLRLGVQITELLAEAAQQLGRS
jgi:hypothetical protein